MEQSDDKKNVKRNGVACDCDLDADHAGIRGLQSHDICTNCSKLYLTTMFSEPEINIPPKGRVGNVDYVHLSVERQLDPEQLQIFLFYMALKQAAAHEKVEHCPFGRYFEIWLKECTSNFFYCKEPTCKKGSGSVCHKEFKIPKSDKKVSKEEIKEMKSK